ncbi:MAG: class I SAM-dependent methyltransferase [Nanoarchaeota archaeon]
MQNQIRVWNAVAEQWHHFRQKPYSEWQFLAKTWKKGKILEVGCGNCRNLLIFAKNGFDCYGIDFSDEMLKYAKKYCKKYAFKVKLKKARAEKLPFKNESFDYVLSIAVLHHLNSKEKRIKSLKEIKRVLKNEGEALILVWNKLIPRFFFKPKDYFVPWRVKGKAYLRYYYFFTYWELKKLLKKSGFKIISSSGMFNKNLLFLVKK